MKKFPVQISGPEGACKRSLTMSQIEVCWTMAAKSVITQHRNYFDLTLTVYGGTGAGKEMYDYISLNKAVVVKRLPNGYLNKFKIPNG